MVGSVCAAVAWRVTFWRTKYLSPKKKEICFIPVDPAETVIAPRCQLMNCAFCSVFRGKHFHSCLALHMAAVSEDKAFCNKVVLPLVIFYNKVRDSYPSQTDKYIFPIIHSQQCT